MQRGRSPVTIGDLIHGGLLRQGQVLRYRERLTDAASLTSSGKIAYREREFASPSSAARVAAGGASTNGWTAWFVEEDGQWVSLADIRKRMLDKSTD